MKTPLFLLLFLCCLTLLTAQEPATTFSVHGGLGIGYRSVDFTQPVSRSVSDGRELFEHSGLSWSAGISGGKQLGRRFWFRTGLRLVNTGYRTDSESTLGVFTGDSLARSGGISSFFGLQTDGIFIFSHSDGEFVFADFPPFQGLSSGMSIDNPITEFYTNFRHVEVPIILRYEINDHRLKPYTEIGVAINYLLFSKFYTVRDGKRNTGTNRKLEGPGRPGVALLFSAGAAYGITGNLDVFISPVLRYNLTAISLGNGNLIEKPRSLIVEAGIRKTIFN